MWKFIPLDKFFVVVTSLLEQIHLPPMSRFVTIFGSKKPVQTGGAHQCKRSWSITEEPVYVRGARILDREVCQS